MTEPLRLAAIPSHHYSDYRYEVIFRAYKWDPQVEDQNTISPYALLMDQATAVQLEDWAEQLSRETLALEEALCCRPKLANALGLPKKVLQVLPRLASYDPGRHIRLMRFDFHPTPDGWAISEVNSDVPGGLAEASVLPEIAGQYFPGYLPRHHVAQSLLQAFREQVAAQGTIAFVHATSYADDRQVMAFISDYFADSNFNTILAAPDHLQWTDRQASCLIEGLEGPVDGIFRFFPLEWLPELPAKTGWPGYYDGITPACNHPAAIFAQSKRLPLIWDGLGVDLPAWKALLPTTIDPRQAKKAGGSWIFKPALGRVGEGISIRETMAEAEWREIQAAALAQPLDWVAQRQFVSRPLLAPDQTAYHLCVGVFTVNAKAAGFYGRISPYPRIDSKAKDIPLLVAKAGGHQ